MSESLGAGQINIEVAYNGEASINQAKTSISRLSESAQVEFNKMDAATQKSVRNMLRLADNVANAQQANKLVYSATQKYGDTFGKEIAARSATSIAALKKQGTAFNEYGRSAKEVVFAMRGVPAQMTDIFTSLQGGQNPLTVLIQQGGQLKDMFGGVVPAAKALGSAVLSLVNPYTVSAAAIATFTAAIYKGSRESEDLSKSLILTGNYAGVTADKLSMMAAKLDGLGGTQAKASEVLGALAATGNIAGESLEKAAQAAIALERVGGQAAEKTIAAFEKLSQSPTKVSAELNNMYNYLDVATYKRIKFLEESGDKAAAAALAEKKYADMLIERSGEMEKKLGVLQQAWRGLKDAASETWDAMLGIGRPDPIQKQIEQLERRLEFLKGGGDSFLNDTTALIAHTEKQLGILKAQQKTEEQIAEKRADQAKKTKQYINTGAEDDKKLAQFRLQLEKQVSDQIAKYRLTEDSFTSSDKERQRMSERLDIRKEYENKVRELESQRENKQITGSLYAKESALLKQNLDLRLKYQDEHYRNVDALESDWRNGAQKGLNEYASQAKNVAGQTASVFTKAFTGMEDAFIKFAMTGKTSFNDLAQSIIADIIRIQIRASVTGPLASMFSGLFTSTPVKSAKGNVFSTPSLSSYSNSIVSQPTVFPFAKGIGLMGEAGSEAIMPLKRMPDGNLGVRSEGGGGNQNIVTINIAADGSARATSNSRDAAMLGKQLENGIMAILVREKRNGGLLSAA